MFTSIVTQEHLKEDLGVAAQTVWLENVFEILQTSTCDLCRYLKVPWVFIRLEEFMRSDLCNSVLATLLELHSLFSHVCFMLVL